MYKNWNILLDNLQIRFFVALETFNSLNIQITYGIILIRLIRN